MHKEEELSVESVFNEQVLGDSLEGLSKAIRKMKSNEFCGHQSVTFDCLR